MLLVQDVTVSLDDPPRRWVPGLPPATDGITLHHLPSHTSGLVDYEDLLPPELDRQVQPDVDGYGYGWRLHASGHGPLQWHSGESIGFRNVLLRWPEQRLTVVVLSNRNGPEPYGLARRLADDIRPRSWK